MKPLGTSGFLFKCMTHALRTFRLDSESLMAALEAFICEPNSCGNDFFSGGSTSNQQTIEKSSDITICKPEYHLNTIKEKLNGINPITPIKNDLQKCCYFWYV